MSSIQNPLPHRHQLILGALSKEVAWHCGKEYAEGDGRIPLGWTWADWIWGCAWIIRRNEELLLFKKAFHKNTVHLRIRPIPLYHRCLKEGNSSGNWLILSAQHPSVPSDGNVPLIVSLSLSLMAGPWHKPVIQQGHTKAHQRCAYGPWERKCCCPSPELWSIRTYSKEPGAAGDHLSLHMASTSLSMRPAKRKMKLRECQGPWTWQSHKTNGDYKDGGSEGKVKHSSPLSSSQGVNVSFPLNLLLALVVFLVHCYPPQPWASTQARGGATEVSLPPTSQAGIHENAAVLVSLWPLHASLPH